MRWTRTNLPSDPVFVRVAFEPFTCLPAHAFFCICQFHCTCVLSAMSRSCLRESDLAVTTVSPSKWHSTILCDCEAGHRYCGVCLCNKHEKIESITALLGSKFGATSVQKSVENS